MGRLYAVLKRGIASSEPYTRIAMTPTRRAKIFQKTKATKVSDERPLPGDTDNASLFSKISRANRWGSIWVRTRPFVLR